MAANLINLRHIEVFHARMHSVSTTEAAQRLHVSHPAVSTVVKHAERLLGLNLLQRVGDWLIPRPKAFALFTGVHDTFGRLEMLGRTAKGLRDAAAGVVSLAVSRPLANALVPAAIATFADEIAITSDAACVMPHNHSLAVRVSVGPADLTGDRRPRAAHPTVPVLATGTVSRAWV